MTCRSYFLVVSLLTLCFSSWQYSLLCLQFYENQKKYSNYYDQILGNGNSSEHLVLFISIYIFCETLTRLFQNLNFLQESSCVFRILQPFFFWCFMWSLSQLYSRLHGKYVLKIHVWQPGFPKLLKPWMIWISCIILF